MNHYREAQSPQRIEPNRSLRAGDAVHALDNCQADKAHIKSTTSNSSVLSII